MSDGIQPIRYNAPQIKRIDRKGSSRGKNENKKEEQEFLDYLSAKDKGGKGKSQDKEKNDQKSKVDDIKEDENTLQKEDYKLDDTCGTIIDEEA
ncbi:MAG: hypothetical protein ACE5KZ_01645 [Candidatus Scalinduaceae bacterium]